VRRCAATSAGAASAADLREVPPCEKPRRA
jgi:hypothetical protein